MTCKNCGREHERVTFLTWSWVFSNYKPKPKGIAAGILFAAARSLNTQTGCGKLTNRDIAEAYGVSDDSVESALKWGREHGLLRRVIRGHNVDGEVEPSHYHLTRSLAGKPNPPVGVPKPASGGDLTRPLAGLSKAVKALKADQSGDAQYDELHAIDPTLTIDEFQLMLKTITEDKRPQAGARAYVAGALAKHKNGEDTAVPNLIARFARGDGEPGNTGWRETAVFEQVASPDYPPCKGCGKSHNPYGYCPADPNRSA